MGKVSQLAWDFSKALSNQRPHAPALGEKARQAVSELRCLWRVLLQKQLFHVKNMYFLHSSLQPHTERKKLSWGREGWCHEVCGRQNRCIISCSKKSPPYTSCLCYPSHHCWWNLSFWKVSLPHRKTNLSSPFRRCFCWQSQTTSLLFKVFQPLWWNVSKHPPVKPINAVILLLGAHAVAGRCARLHHPLAPQLVHCRVPRQQDHLHPVVPSVTSWSSDEQAWLWFS